MQFHIMKANGCLMLLENDTSLNPLSYVLHQSRSRMESNVFRRGEWPSRLARPRNATLISTCHVGQDTDLAKSFVSMRATVYACSFVTGGHHT